MNLFIPTLGDARRRAKLTQKQVADALKLTNQSISSWERGKNKPSLNPLQTATLCKLYKISLNELTELTENTWKTFNPTNETEETELPDNTDNC